MSELAGAVTLAAGALAASTISVELGISVALIASRSPFSASGKSQTVALPT